MRVCRVGSKVCPIRAERSLRPESEVLYAIPASGFYLGSSRKIGVIQSRAVLGQLHIRKQRRDFHPAFNWVSEY